MNQKRFAMIFASLMILLVGCGTNDTAIKNDGNNNDNHQEIEASTENNDKVEQASNTTLPDGFPDDFPFPDDITITEVRDNSEGSQKDFTIRFTFDPDIDFDAVTEMYQSYMNKIDYKPIVEGEEYFAEDIYQFAALSESSRGDMFMVTMQPTDDTYGSIDLKYQE